MKTKELIYMVLDLMKDTSDDAYFTEEHVLWLLNKNRSFLLKREYDLIKRQPSEINKLTICVDLYVVNGIENDPCSGVYLKSTQVIPDTINSSNPQVTTIDYFNSNIVYVSPNKMRYVSFNKYLKNIIYCAIGDDKHLYLKSANSLFSNLEKVKFTAVFEDFEKAYEMSCDNNEDINKCDPFENEFPLDSYLIPELIDRVLRELLGASYRPKDTGNDASDSLSYIANFIRNYVKQPLLRQIDGTEQE